MQITLDLNDEQADRLAMMAESLGVDPHELARAAFADLLGKLPEDFLETAKHVLAKNRDLYERLS